MSFDHHLVPLQKYFGTLSIAPPPNRFAYLKIEDKIVFELFKKFKAERDEPGIQLPPYFEPSEAFPNPVGAHITIISTRDFSSSYLPLLSDFEGSSFPFECVRIQGVNPRFWKQMEKAYLCFVKCPALERINQMLGTDCIRKDPFHFTFAVKPRTESIEPALRCFTHFDAVSIPFEAESILPFHELSSAKTLTFLDEFNPSGLIAHECTHILQAGNHRAIENEGSVTHCILNEPIELYVADTLKDVAPQHVNQSHIFLAKSRGFIHVARMLERKLELAEEGSIDRDAESDNEDFISSKLDEIESDEEDLDDDLISYALDEIEVPLRRRSVKNEDLVTSILKNRFDDSGVLRKIKRLNKSRFDTSHVRVAQKHDLHVTEQYIKKALV